MNIRNLTTISAILCSLIALTNCIDANTTSRIYGGTEAADGQFPYMGFIRLNDKPRCGCSIINVKYVLTAGHCVFYSNKTQIPANVLTVGVGTNNRTGPADMIPVEEVKPHRWFSFPNFDFALLSLTRLLIFSELVRPIPIATRHPLPGKKCTVSGWGRTSTDPNGVSMLRFLEVTILSAEECYPPPRKNVPSVFCGSSAEGQGVCFGDSGSPVVFNNSVIGCTSYVRTGCATVNPDGFAKCAYAHPWLLENSAYP